jgi:cytochrome c-type biogenesis protein CcmE
MKSRHKRMMFIVVGLAGVAAVFALVLNALQSNINHFFSPTEVAANKAPADRTFRLGGLVEKGSLVREDDNIDTIMVTYTGILPDLFSEGQGMVAQGKLGTDGVFIADEVLAKHDEKYMPPEVAEALKKADKQKQTTVPQGGI